jgi:DNA-binding response OmpR family regulator
LRKEGYSVISFSDPQLALEHIKKNHYRYSLLITDIKMPSMSGIELVKKIREINTTMRIFLMTAYDISNFENSFDIRAFKIDRLVQKPFRFSEMIEMIKIALER